MKFSRKAGFTATLFAAFSLASVHLSAQPHNADTSLRATEQENFLLTYINWNQVK
jgi:hypothetical protein